ncbi:MAG: outer membrane beta-barrel family protein, partial [Muribaculaceae bacterium]|nr:outer membrane beta-barrel family protein [Muribaculaceae bacterium]
ISRRITTAARIGSRTEVDFNKGTGQRTSSSADSNSMLPENFTVPGSADFVRDMLYYRSERLNGRDQTFGVTGRLLSSLYKTFISLEANVAYHNSRVKSNGSDQITYPNEQNRDISLLRHDLAPSRDYSFDIRPSWGKYRIQLGEKQIMRANIAYKYQQKYNYGRRTLEEMDNQAGTNAAPSVSEAGSWFLDEANSYRTTRREWNNGFEANLGFVFPHKISITIYDESYYSVRRLTDFRMSTLREVARNDWKNSLNLKLDYGDSWEPGFACGISGRFNQGLPEMLKMLDVIDTSNPLVVNLGNPNLKREKKYELSAHVDYKKATGLKPSLSFSGGWSRVDDALAMARTYDRQTGVTTWQPANISGRWDAFIDFNAFTFLTRDGNFVFENRLRPTFRHSTDYSSDGDIPEPVAVNSWNVNDNLILRYGISSDLNFRAKVTVDWTKMKSLNGLFLPFDYLDINYGIGAHAKIPGEVYVDTDLMAYCRRGYGDPTMNRTDWVWNLEISKTFGRAKQFTVKAIGFDLLQQLPTVQRTLNAQGRSEVRYNSQPAYALLTLAYRLDIQPKKKK